MSEIEDLKKRVAELEKAAKPPEPAEPIESGWKPGMFDPTAGMSMPANALRAMIDGVPESVMQGIRGDARRPNPVTEASSSPLTTTPSALSQPQRGSGWVEPRPLESPPGLKYVDAQIDAQDAKDRAELELRIAQAELSKSK